MPIPGTQEIRKPLLEAFRGEAPHNFINSEILELIAEYFNINLNDLSSGEKNILKSGINEAKADLKKNGLIYNPSGNTYMITIAGTKVLEDNPEIITDEYLKARKKKTLPVAETFGLEIPEHDKVLEIQESEPEPEVSEIEAEPETLQEDEAIPETEIEPEIPELEPEAETLPEDSLLPETEPEQEVSEIVPEPETLQEDEAIPETEIEPEIPEVEPEAETLLEDSPLLEEKEELEIPEIESETLQEESPTLEDELEAESENEAVPDTENEPELQEPELDDSDDIHLDDEPEEYEENQPEDFADREFNDAPGENLDTEEDTDNMPEDLYSPEESQEDFTPATDETEQEEEYNPALLAAAMSTNSIDDAIARHNSELADELLMKAAGLPSDRFEMLVIDLLSKMGYFAFQTARYTTESSGSDLIHGVILDNQTGANIYIQARKLSPGRTIGKADIQDFVDELSDKGGKGIYATTASFSENAKILATDERIMLIDGEKLANLMIANNFCVNVEKVYEIKAIDSESFSEYED